jgi:UDP-N-acetylmuramate--alanine ligase
VTSLAGRNLWFVGIGGAGMSALAVVCRDWGAEVGGSDRDRTPYVELLERQGISVTVGHAAANVPPDAEVIASSAVAEDNPELLAAGDRVRRRGELLAELVALRPAIVVAGAHGKTTTASMIAFCLDRLGLDPAFLIGADVPQLGGNGRAGEGWLVAEGDESDRSLLLLCPRIAVVTNVELDHHATFASQAEVEELFAEWLRSLPADAVTLLGDEVAPLAADLGLAVPGDHNRMNAACALAALTAAGVDGGAAARALTDFRGAGRRFQIVGEAGGVRVVDDYGHHPTEVVATLAAARAEAGDGRVVALFQPHLYSRTVHLAGELGAALAAADEVVVTEIYPAREEPLPGVSAKLIVERLAERRPGMVVGWAPGLEDAAALAAMRSRAGDLVLTIGAGDVDRAGPLILAALGRRGGTDGVPDDPPLDQ